MHSCSEWLDLFSACYNNIPKQRCLSPWFCCHVLLSPFTSVHSINKHNCGKYWLPWWYPAADNEQMVRSVPQTTKPTKTMHTISSVKRVGGCSSTTTDGYLGTACPNNRWWTDGYVTTCQGTKSVVRQWQKYQSGMFTDIYNVYTSDSPKFILESQC